MTCRRTSAPSTPNRTVGDRGIAGTLPKLVVDDMKSKGTSPLYLVTDHAGFYERYGGEFLCMVRSEDRQEMSRMYIRR